MCQEVEREQPEDPGQNLHNRLSTSAITNFQNNKTASRKPIHQNQLEAEAPASVFELLNQPETFEQIEQPEEATAHDPLATPGNTTPLG